MNGLQKKSPKLQARTIAGQRLFAARESWRVFEHLWQNSSEATERLQLHSSRGKRFFGSRPHPPRPSFITKLTEGNLPAAVLHAASA